MVENCCITNLETTKHLFYECETEFLVNNLIITKLEVER